MILTPPPAVALRLASILICPACHANLDACPEGLACSSCARVYDVEDGVAVLLGDAARVSDPAPRLYDVLQLALGARRSIARVRRVLLGLEPRAVLDVGGGTALYASAVPPGATYTAVDIDLAKLRRNRAHPRGDAVLADASTLPVRTGAVDVAMFIAVAHHLSDEDLERALAELARVARRVVVLEPLAGGRFPASALWRLDRGARPRTLDELTEAVRRWFDVDEIEVYTTVHRYALFVGTARRLA